MKWNQDDDKKRPWVCLNCLAVRPNRFGVCACGGRFVIRAGNDSTPLAIGENDYGYEK